MKIALTQSGIRAAPQPQQAELRSPGVTAAAAVQSALQLPLQSAGDLQWDARTGTLSKQQEIPLIFRCRHFAERAKGTKQMLGSLQHSSPLTGIPLEQ